MRRFLLAALLLVFAEAGSADESWGLVQLMQGMAGVQSSSAIFTETKYVSALTAPLSLSGRLFYLRPGRVEKHVLAPYDEHLIAEDERLTLKKNGQSHNFVLQSNPVAWAFVESIRATLSGDLLLLQRFYRTRLEGDRSAWQLILEPLDGQMLSYVQSIRISGHGNQIDRIETLEAGGDRSVMNITGSGA
jgi:hypothetical protein